MQTNSSVKWKTERRATFACSYALYNPGLRGYHASVYPNIAYEPGDFMSARLTLSLRLFCITVFSLLAVLSVGCSSGKQVRVTVEDEFNVMAKRLAPVLRHRGVIDEHGAYFFAKPELPTGLGEYLFQRLSRRSGLRLIRHCCRRPLPPRARRGTRWRCSPTAFGSGRARTS